MCIIDFSLCTIEIFLKKKNKKKQNRKLITFEHIIYKSIYLLLFTCRLISFSFVFAATFCQCFHLFQWQFMRFTIERGKYNFHFILITARTSGKSSIKCLLWCNLQFRLHSWPTFLERSTDIGVNLFMAILLLLLLLGILRWLVGSTCGHWKLPQDAKCAAKQQQQQQHSTKKQRHGNAATLSVFLFPFAILACYFFAGYALCTHTHQHTPAHTHSKKSNNKNNNYI